MQIDFYLHTPMLPNAGAPGAVLALAGALEEIGHRCSITTFDDMLGIPERIKSPLFPWYTAWHAQRSNRRTSPDVIDASTGDSWLFGLLSRENRPLLVTHSHGLEHVVHDAYLANLRKRSLRPSWRYPLYNGSVRLWEVRQSLRNADLCLFLNKRDREVAVDRLGLDPARCRIVPNGCDRAILMNRTVLTPSQGERGLGIAWVGSFIQRKGAEYAVEALNRYLFVNPSATVTLLGTGLSEAEVREAFAAHAQNSLSVVEKYSREELPRLLSGCDVLLFPSLAEGFPLALIEAMACGLAPIATNIPGPTEVVAHEREGLLIPPGDALAIEAALERLSNDRDLLMSLRSAAWDKASGYSWSSIAAQRQELYREFIDRRTVERSGRGQ